MTLKQEDENKSAYFFRSLIRYIIDSLPEEKQIMKTVFNYAFPLTVLAVITLSILGSNSVFAITSWFAISFRENGWGGLLSQGIGTSMLQMPNIVKNPRIWIPPTLASAITGPIATCLFKLEMNGAAVSSGMGTCGFVGQIGVYTGWVNDTQKIITAWDWTGLVLICFILPALLSWIFCQILRKWGWIKPDDLKLDL